MHLTQVIAITRKNSSYISDRTAIDFSKLVYRSFNKNNLLLNFNSDQENFVLYIVCKEFF